MLHGQAADRVEGLSGEEYVEQAIVAPDEHTVEGFDAGLMPANYGELMTDEEVEALVVYLLSDPQPPTRSRSDSRVENADSPGEAVWYELNCHTCHTLDGTRLIGPTAEGLGEEASDRVPGLSAEEYVRQSIVEPGAYIVEGFDNLMPGNYGEIFTEDDIDALVEFLLSQ